MLSCKTTVSTPNTNFCNRTLNETCSNLGRVCLVVNRKRLMSGLAFPPPSPLCTRIGCKICTRWFVEWKSSCSFHHGKVYLYPSLNYLLQHLHLPMIFVQSAQVLISQTMHKRAKYSAIIKIMHFLHLNFILHHTHIRMEQLCHEWSCSFLVKC